MGWLFLFEIKSTQNCSLLPAKKTTVRNQMIYTCQPLRHQQLTSLIRFPMTIKGSIGKSESKVPIFGPKKWHIEWPNQNSKTTFIVQTFPKYGPYGFDLVNLSLFGAILAIFQFCGFSGLFWPFFSCKKLGSDKNDCMHWIMETGDNSRLWWRKIYSYSILGPITQGTIKVQRQTIIGSLIRQSVVGHTFTFSKRSFS